MDRFVSNTINRVDKKGRVSIPAGFRAVLAGQSILHMILSVEHPVAEAGGADFVDMNMQRLSQMDPFSEEYEMWSFCMIGDADELKIDTEGRIILSENIREHTGITDTVAFVGRGPFFQLWEPERFADYREAARSKVRMMRRELGMKNSTVSANSPEGRTESAPPTRSSGGSGSKGKMGNEGQET
jgi:MraZ protein